MTEPSARKRNWNNQFLGNPSMTDGAKHIRMRKVRGKAKDHICVCCLDQAAEWAQVHDTDGDNPWDDFMPLCIPCHRFYDGTPEAVAASNIRRTGEKRRQYVIRNPEAYRAAQSARSLKRWGGEA